MKKNKSQRSPSLTRIGTLVLTIIHSNLLIAGTGGHLIPLTVYTSRITGQILTGGEDQLGGFADALLPLVQNPYNLFFADASVMLGRHQIGTYSAGLGLRSMQGPGILGGFAFVENYHTAADNSFWLFNPGVEWLTTGYEARLQGYIPTNRRVQSYRTTLASALPQEVLDDSGRRNTFFGAQYHRVFDTALTLTEQVGPGVEIEAGKRFDIATGGTWLRVGAYHYNFSNVPDVNGVQGNVEVGIYPYLSLIVQNNYDNQNRNSFSVGVRASFGGTKAPPNTLEKRMVSPIIRHQARQSYGQAIPSRLNFQVGQSFDLVSNAWFFSPNGTPPPGVNTSFANCTAENPCQTIDSATAAQIQALAPQANLLFETGTYVIPAGNINSMRWVNLYDGQTVQGRNVGWFTPATTTTRPTIFGGLFWGNAGTGRVASGLISDMVIINQNQLIPGGVSGFGFDNAIAAGAYGNLTISNSSLSATNTIAGPGPNYATGAFTANNLSITNSTIEAFASASEAGFAGAYGIHSPNTNATDTTEIAIATSVAGRAEAAGIFSTNNAMIVNNTTTASSTVGSGAGAANATAIYATNDVTVLGGTQTALATAVLGEANAYSILAAGDIFSTTSNQVAIASSQEGLGFAVGLFGNNVVDVGSTQNTSATSTTAEAQSRGIYAINNATATQSQQTSNATSTTGNASAAGIFSTNEATASEIEQVITATSESGNAAGIGVFGDTVTVENSNITVTAESETGIAEATGVMAITDGTVTNTTINVNTSPGGVETKCQGVTSPDESCTP